MGKHFTKAERNGLSILLKKGYSRRQIADALRKNHSSITREINRNKVKGVYEPSKADTKSRVRRRSSKYQNMKVNGSPEFIKFLTEQLKTGWTPEQIAGRWNYKDPNGKHFSFKSIYKFLYSAPGQHLCKYLLCKHYNPYKRWGNRRKRLPIKNRVSIEKRPKIINERKRFGTLRATCLER